MASYDDGMPEGLTFKNEQHKSDSSYKAAENSLKQFLSLSETFGKNNVDLQSQIVELVKQQQKLYRRFDEEQQQRKLDAQLLREKGASEEEILAYLSKREDIYGKETKALFSSFESLKSTMEQWIDDDEETNGEQRLLLRKQLEAFEKSYDLEEYMTKTEKKKVSFLERISDNTKETLKATLEEGKESRRDLLGTLGATLLGPLRLVVDPLAEAFTGSDSKELLKKGLEKWDERRVEQKEKDKESDTGEKRDQFFSEALLQEKSPLVESRQVFSLPTVEEISSGTEVPPLSDTGEKRDQTADTIAKEIPGLEEFFLSKNDEDPLMVKITPTSSQLLSKGGIIGASTVFLARQLTEHGKGTGEDEEDGEGILDSLFDNKGGGILKKALKKFAPTLASAAGAAAVAAVPIAMLAGGAALQKRDTEDAKKHLKDGNYGRAAETAWLGDRDRLTEENANSELGRATGKAALLAGGAAGVGALTLGGGAAAGMTAGGAAAAAGAGLGGTALAAAGATAAAVIPPVLVAAAIAAAVTVVAKGTQEAFELGWDKNQAEIQKELTDIILSDDASAWQKIKATVSSDWKNFTGTIAGGIRGFSEELQKDVVVEHQRQLEYISQMSAEGNEEYTKLLETLKDEEFQAMSKKDQERYLKAEGIFDEYQKSLDETQNSFGENLLNGARAMAAGVKGALKVQMEAQSGIKGAFIDKQLLKEFDMNALDKETRERYKNSDAYAQAIADGKDSYAAMQAAYLDEKHKENAALGIQKENGVAVGFQDYAVTYFSKKKDDESYRQTHEYEQEKARLMDQGLSSEEADLEAIRAYNEMYDNALELRLKQTDDFRETYKKLIKEGKDTKTAEKEALKVAKENRRNTMTVTELIKDKFNSLKDGVTGFFTSIGDKASEMLDAARDSEFGQAISQFASSIWGAVTDWFGRLGGWFSDKWETVTSALSGAREAVGGLFESAREGVSNWWESIAGGSSPDAAIEDGIVTKDGKVIQLSPDDTVYATKNDPVVVGDRDAQRAMPTIPKEPSEFTDKGIIDAIQTLTEVLKGKNFKPEISIESCPPVDFSAYRSA